MKRESVWASSFFLNIFKHREIISEISLIRIVAVAMNVSLGCTISFFTCVFIFFNFWSHPVVWLVAVMLPALNEFFFVYRYYFLIYKVTLLCDLVILINFNLVLLCFEYSNPFSHTNVPMFLSKV